MRSIRSGASDYSRLVHLVSTRGLGDTASTVRRTPDDEPPWRVIDDAIGRLLDDAPPAARAFWSSFEELVRPGRRRTALQRGSQPDLPPLPHCVLRTFHHWLSGAQGRYLVSPLWLFFCVAGCVRAGRRRRGIVTRPSRHPLPRRPRHFPAQASLTRGRAAAASRARPFSLASSSWAAFFGPDTARSMPSLARCKPTW